METLQKLHKSFIDQIYKVEKIQTYRSNAGGTKKKCTWSVLICIIFWEETFGKLFRTSAAHLSAGLKHRSKTQRKKLLSNYASAPNMGGETKCVPYQR